MPARCGPYGLRDRFSRRPRTRYARAVDPHRAVIAEAEVERLIDVFLRVRLLARERGLDVFAAAAEAMREGLVAERDWRAVRRAIAD